MNSLSGYMDMLWGVSHVPTNPIQPPETVGIPDPYL